jgi:hypothetical protein
MEGATLPLEKLLNAILNGTAEELKGKAEDLKSFSARGLATARWRTQGHG